MKNLSMIAAIGENFELGYQNQLLCHLPADLKYFKEKTSGCPVIMGDRTWESLPKKPLPNRRNIVITLDKNAAYQDCEVVHSIEDAMDLVRDEKESFIIGGATIYSLFIGLIGKLYLTRIHSDFTADVYFPRFNENEWTLISEQHSSKDEKNQYDLTFQIFERK
ncbi:MAG TPA: dihydrofolate reductase [Bacteroidales bacterium]|jgi:dihydrofolate reductase|nr:dihydrofolate reductase [Bacteroidales bacterium]